MAEELCEKLAELRLLDYNEGPHIDQRQLSSLALALWGIEWMKLRRTFSEPVITVSEGSELLLLIERR